MMADEDSYSTRSTSSHGTPSPSHNHALQQYIYSQLDGRFKQLQDEREEVQKKTFTKWVNSHLQRVTCRILDLYMDLRDGRMLIKLLEVLCGEALPKPTRGKMRIHSLENVDKTLQFLKDQKVHLENMGSHDIVDGNHRLTLGLIWTIILRFQIQDISIETEDNTEKKSAKDALLLWCQMKTKEYSNVRIKNFTTSWRDGLAFNALIHKHRPDLIDFDNLKKSTPEKNLQNAFSVAEQDLGLTKLLDPEDVNLEQPDEKSVMTYVVTYYHYFNKMKALAVEGKRIGKVLDNAIEAEKMANEYDSLASDLLLWIDHTISSLNGREFPNSLGGVQQLLQAFSMYRTTEKPPNFIKKGDLEVLLFTIQSKMRANNQKVFTPRDGKLVGDINRAWEDLERAEHERELALRNELIRQEKLEQLAHRFGRKAALRETWLSENQRLIAQDNFGHDLAAVEAADKKHEAIETDIAAYRERVQAVVAVASELESEQYHDVAQVLEQRDNMQNLWEVLQELLAARRQRLEQHLALQRAFQEMLYIMSWMDEMKGRLQSQDYGKHLLDVEDLLQKHSLLEADITIQAEPVKTVCAAASKFSENGEGYKPCEPNEVQEHVTLLEDEYRELGDLAIARRARLEDSRRLHQFLWDTAEVEVWAREVEPLLASEDIGRDLTGAQRLLTRHEAFEDEMIGRHNRLHQVTAEGQRLVDDGHFGAPQIEKRLADIAQCWAALEKLASKRKQLLEKAVGLYTVQADADDLVGWLSAVSCLASSEDFGHDEASARALDKKHKELHEEVESYRPALSTMNEQLQAVPPEILEETGVAQHVQDLDVQFNTVAGHAAARRKRLDDTLALYTMFSEAEACDLWIDEKGKWLHSLQIPDTLEDLEVMQHRFETLEPEMNGIASRIGIVNDLANRLLQDEHPSEAEIKCKSDNLNSRWKDFCDMLEKKKDGLHSTLRLKNFKLDSHETKMWIKDKTRVIESTQDLGNDLAGVMALQRKLSGMERDLSAIESKLSDLQAEAEGLAMKHPDQAAEIIAQLEDIQEAWAELKETLRNREESLGEATKLQKFLQDVDDFQAWLSKTQRDIASEDLQVSPDEMEMLLRQHEAIKNEIDNSQDDFHHIQDMGKVVTQDQTDPQYMFLQQRLQALDSGWDDLNKMWDNQHRMLSQTHAYTSFIHDAHQAEGILSNQEYVLGRVEMPKTLEVAEVAIKKHEGFLKTMDTNEEKIISVMDSGRTLIAEQNPNSNKIQETIDSIDERHTRNRAAAKDALTQFKDNKTLQTFLQHCQDLKLWIDEKMLTAQDMSYDEARDLHSKWQKHQAFTAEMSSNKEWLDKVDDDGLRLAAEKPEFAPVVQEHLDELHRLWDCLDSATQHKAKQLFDANRAELITQSCGDLEKWIKELDGQVHSDDYGKDLTSVNILLKKQQFLEDQMKTGQKEVIELQSQSQALQQEGKNAVEVDCRRQSVEHRFKELNQPLLERRNKLMASKEVHQLNRDLEDEMLWIDERMPLATSTDCGSNLQTVQLLTQKNENLQKEIQGHEPRVSDVLQRGKDMAAHGEGEPEALFQKLTELDSQWLRLSQEVGQRRSRLDEALRGQQYLFDATEAKNWMVEQELYMIAEEKAKDEQSSTAMLNKHKILEDSVKDYNDVIQQLDNTSRNLIDQKHPESELICQQQAEVSRLYGGLLELAQERRTKLEQQDELLQLQREVSDLQQWIDEHEVSARSHELGQDFEHITMLQQHFSKFSRDTVSVGQERVTVVDSMVNGLVAKGHPDVETAISWKSNLEESWEELLELLATRTAALGASHEFHRIVHDVRAIGGRINEKHQQLPDDFGRDLHAVEDLQRKHAAFKNDVHALEVQVNQIQEDIERLRASYAGEKADELDQHKEDVTSSWGELLSSCEERHEKLARTEEKYCFLSLIRDLMLWMEQIMRQLDAQEKPRDVSGVEMQMNNHEHILAEIDARQDNFSSAIRMGNDLLAKNHYASPEIKEKLEQLQEKRKEMTNKWEFTAEWLKLMLEVYQFSRDATVAEAWLLAQDPHITSQEMGASVDEVEDLLKRHEAFEKSVTAWDERFANLVKLTGLELKELKKKQEQEQAEQELRLQEQLAQEEEARRQREEKQREKKLKEEEERNLRLSTLNAEHIEGSKIAVNGTDGAEGGDDSIERTPSTPNSPQASGPSTPGKTRASFREGILVRKHELDTNGKKASSRSWNSIYCVHDEYGLSFYKDAKNASSGNKYHNEQSLALEKSTCTVATDYKKRKLVFKLQLADGSEYLFQAKDNEDMQAWLQTLSDAALSPSGSPSSESKPVLMRSKSATLDSPAKEKKDKAKRLSLFSKKK